MASGISTLTPTESAMDFLVSVVAVTFRRGNILVPKFPKVYILCKHTPWKLNMETKNRSIQKENHLLNLYSCVPAVNFPGCSWFFAGACKKSQKILQKNPCSGELPSTDLSVKNEFPQKNGRKTPPEN